MIDYINYIIILSNKFNNLVSEYHNNEKFLLTILNLLWPCKNWVYREIEYI